MKKNILMLFLSLNLFNLDAQIKIGSNPKNISNNANLEVEASAGRAFVVTKDSSKVGVGTLSPSHLIHIIDSINDPVRIVGLKSGKSTDSLLIVDSLGVIKRLSSLSLGSMTEPWFNAATNTAATSNTQNIYQMGRVGINVTNPTWMLDVRTNSVNSELVGHFVNSSQASTAESQVAIGAGPGVWTKIVGYDGTLGIRNYSTNKEFVSFKPHTGFVGIGTNSPISRFHVVKDSSESEIYDDYLFDSYGTTVQGMELRKFNGKVGSPINITNGTLIGYYGFSPRANNNNLYGTTGMFGYYTGDGINANSELRFRTSYLDRMTINSSGFVGVGTTNPLHELHIVNTGANITPWDKGLLHLQNGDIHYTISLANNFNNANWGSSAADYLANGVNNAMVINLGGMGQYIFGDHVGPWATGAYDLGSSYARWNNIYLTNSPNVSSDLRLKSEIKPLDLGLKEILKLQPKMYKKHNDFDKKSEGKEEYGFIAQELKEVLPIVVTGNEHDGNPLGVMYEQVIPVMTQAIKELKNEMDQIENINQELKEKLNQKDLEISKLKDMILELRQEFQNLKSANK